MISASNITRIRADESEWEIFPMPEGSVVSGRADALVIWARSQAEPPFYAGIWRIDACVFDWVFDMHETAHITEGHAFITPEGRETLEVKPGDVLCFPKGMRARWDVRVPLQKVFVDSA